MLETKLHDSKNEFGVITNFPHAQMGEKQNAPLVLGMQPRIEETVVLNEGEEVSAKQNAGDENLYFCQHLTGGAKHPGIIVETAGLANIKPPRPVYRPHLPVELVISGKISQIQLERIIYAGQAHGQRLPESAARAGISIGDGTGVGKTGEENLSAAEVAENCLIFEINPEERLDSIIERVKESYVRHHLQDKSIRRMAKQCGISRYLIMRIADKMETSRNL